MFDIPDPLRGCGLNVIELALRYPFASNHHCAAANTTIDRADRGSTDFPGQFAYQAFCRLLDVTFAMSPLLLEFLLTFPPL